MTYKPITVSVRGIYTDRVEHILGSSREQIRAEFDAWLNGELAKAWDRAESAFEEAHNADMIEPWTYMQENPYRKAEK